MTVPPASIAPSARKRTVEKNRNAQTVTHRGADQYVLYGDAPCIHRGADQYVLDGDAPCTHRGADQDVLYSDAP